MIRHYLGYASAVIALSSTGKDRCNTNTSTRVRLRPGDAAVERRIDSRLRRNRTGIEIDGGGHYTLTTSGKWQDGPHLSPVTAGGFGLSAVPWYGKPLLFLGAPFRRKSRANWFALIGELSSRPKDFFTIGDSLAFWTAPLLENSSHWPTM